MKHLVQLFVSCWSALDVQYLVIPQEGGIVLVCPLREVPAFLDVNLSGSQALKLYSHY